jgi:type VI secretion system protein ImpA
MPSESVLDFEALLAPISESEPCGTQYEAGKDPELGRLFGELRSLAPIARKIESARYELAFADPTARRETLRDTEGRSDGPSADPKWGRIAELSTGILCKHSKDVRAIVSLIDSHTRIHGLAGLRDSINLSCSLIEQFGVSLFPTAEPGGPAYSCLEFISKAFESEKNNVSRAIRQLSIFENANGFSLFAHEMARLIEKRSMEDQQKYAEAGDRTLQDFESQLRNEEDVQSLEDFNERIKATIEPAKKLDDLIAKFTDNQWGVRRLVDDLLGLQRWYLGIVEDRILALKDNQPADELSSTVSTAGTQDKSNNSGSMVQAAISNREQALSNLLQVAKYFRQTEPHSPLSYALEQAVRWGRMPLPDLLKDLVSDTSVLNEVCRRMGIQQSEENL